MKLTGSFIGGTTLLSRKVLKQQINFNKNKSMNETDWITFIQDVIIEISPYYDKIKSDLHFSENRETNMMVPMISTRQIVTVRHLINNLVEGNIKEAVHEYFDFIKNYNMGKDEFSALELCILYEMGELICSKWYKAK